MIDMPNFQAKVPLQLQGEPLRYQANTSSHKLHQHVGKEIYNLLQIPPSSL